MKGMHGIIFSYGEKPGLGQLTAKRIHGSLPFGGDYRVVDFMLSNMVNAGITDVGVIMHGKCQSMLDHLGTGKSWDLSRKTGGLKLLPAFAYSESRSTVGPFRGKMEALGCVIEYLRHIRQDYVVLSDSDLVANLPLRSVLDAHIASGADMTCVCTSHPGESGDTYFTLDDTGRIVDTAYDVRTPEGYQSLNIFLLSRELLLELVEECMAHDRYSFRRNVLQEKGKTLRFNGYVWDGFAARINSVQAYYQRSMELLRPEIRSELFCAQRPVYAKENDLYRPGRRVRQLPDLRRLRHPGQRPKLRAVPGCPGGKGRPCGELHPVQGHGGEGRGLHPLRHRRQERGIRRRCGHGRSRPVSPGGGEKHETVTGAKSDGEVSLAEFAARRRRNNLIIFPAACTSEKYFSAASVSEGRAQSAASHIGRKIARFFASHKEEDNL